MAKAFDGKTQSSYQTKLSKALSWLLRHGAEQEGFQFSEGGFLYVDDILKHHQFKGKTQTDIEALMKNDEKGRFFLQMCPRTNRLQIRANQGHSLKVENLKLIPIVDPVQAPVVVHGTYEHCWESIKNEGLSRMKRNHIHFSASERNSGVAISGIRQSCQVFIYINIAHALQDGIPFYRSANNVILSPGDENGLILPKYFGKVEHTTLRK